MLPRGLFLLAETATSCLFSTAETPLQIERGFPAEVSNIRSAGTRLPTSFPGLQLSQGEKAVYSVTGMQSCSTSDPHCSPAGPTFLQRKHFHCSQQKVTTSRRTHHLALVPSEASFCTQKDFRLPTAVSLRARYLGTTFHRRNSLCLTGTEHSTCFTRVLGLCVRSPELQAMLHPTGQPRNQELQGKAATSSSSPRTERQGREALVSQAIYAPTSTSAAAQPCRAGELGDTRLRFPGLAARGRTCQQITHQQKKASAFPCYQDEATLH